MKEINYENVKVNDLVRYQFCMNCRNCYSIVVKITKAYLILKDGMKFKKKDGWSTSKRSGYHISGINDQEEHYYDDEADLYYW